MPTIADYQGRPVEVVRQVPARTVTNRGSAVVLLLLMHVVPLMAIAAGVAQGGDWVVAAGMFHLLAFAVIGGCHRYFSHRSYETSRVFQGLLALGAGLAFTDPIGFAGKHRLHHRYSDTEGDVHTPDEGFWYCWLGSLVDEGYKDEVIMAQARDFARYPELRWLHRWLWVPGVTLAISFYLIGGWGLLAIGYLLPLALLTNLASAVNYFCHLYGTRRYETADASRNNWVVALLTFGEGWHNNHHHFPGAARAGFYWWELDPTYWAIRCLAALGLVWNIREVPEKVLRG